MADMNLLEQLNQDDEAATSVVLDTLMYCESLKNSRSQQGKTVSEIVNTLVNNRRITGDRHEALESVQLYIQNYAKSHNGAEPEVAGLKLSTSSDFSNYGHRFGGAHAATFYKENSNGSKDVYVAFKGTGDGRWFDNGYAFAAENSHYQYKASSYFDYAMEELGVDESCNVITTGHSKGGNLSQYVALASKHAGLVDRVLSFDGQGFSPEAIDYMKSIHGEEFYNEQCQKMFSISGDNDFVNVLGIKVIPEDNTVYIQTAEGGFADNHALFVNYKDKYRAGAPNFFDYGNDEFFAVAEDRKRFSLVSEHLSNYVMSLPEDKRGAVCRSLMAAMELAMGGDEKNLLTGEYGETATIKDIIGGLTQLDDITLRLVADDSVQSMIDDKVGSWLREHDPFRNNIFLSRSLALTLSMMYQNKGVDLIIATGEAVIYAAAKAISLVGDAAQKLTEFVEFGINSIKAAKDSLIYAISGRRKEAQQYLAQSNIIKCDTGALRNLADRLRRLNTRLSYLDDELSRLYREVKWTDLWTLQSADMKIGYSNRLQKCADYLSNTADRFEAAESEILGLFG